MAPFLFSCTVLPFRTGDPPGFAPGGSVIDQEANRFPNWPLEPLEAEALVETRAWQPTRSGRGLRGTTGAERIALHFPSRQMTVDFKWKQMVWSRRFQFFPGVPGTLDGVNNSPRKELAAWQLQQLFLDPEDYVVPTSVAYCAALSEIQDLAPEVEPTVEGSRCILGVLSLWMRDVTLPKTLPDLERFRRDPVYAHYLSNLNLFTYLVKHHDGREGNFLIAENDARPQLFAIDNGVAFGGVYFNWFVRNWDNLRVPALRRDSIDRLRSISESDLQQALGVVAELRLDEDGIFRNAEPGPNLDPGAGVRLEDGVLQFGLTDDEIEDVWERIEDLIEDVDEDDLAVF